MSDYIDSSQSHIAALEAERNRLREQLDAARQALQAYHDLAPALAECANDCGEARLYSDLKQANDRARAALGVEGERQDKLLYKEWTEEEWEKLEEAPDLIPAKTRATARALAYFADSLRRQRRG